LIFDFAAERRGVPAEVKHLSKRRKIKKCGLCLNFQAVRRRKFRDKGQHPAL